MKALLVAAAIAASAPSGWDDGVRSAHRYAEGRTGTVAFAVRTQRGIKGRSLDQPFQSASLAKAMLLLAYLRQPTVLARDLRAGERKLLGPMIARSSNKAANTIRVRLGPGALTRIARRAGMTRFVEGDGCWGCSLITARDQTRLFLRIDGLLPRRHRAYGLELLTGIVPRQRWGVGQVASPGWALFFKGGWGSGRGLVDHQVALLTRGEQRIAVAVLTAGNADHADGKATLEGTFRRLLRPLR